MTEPITTILATIVAKEALSALIKPLINKALKTSAAISDVAIDTFTNQFVAYIDRQVEKHFYLNTVVFQNQVPLENLYIPLSVVPQTMEESQEENHITIKSFDHHFIPCHKRVLVTDTAGMGKSTLMKFLLIQCIRSNSAIPVFIELRHLSPTQSVMSLLETELNYDSAQGSPRFSPEKIRRILEKGGLVFFFDGYDEISFKNREVVTKDIKGFIEAFPNNYFALTSRPESGLSAFPSFAQFKIRPLTREESFTLIKKYDGDGKRSAQLIERLKGPELAAVHEFLENPLLTTLLYRCFEYKQNVPDKKHIFYRQVFDALFDWHDASKDGYNTREKKSKLDLDSFHRVLRVIGFISTLNGEIEGDKDQVLNWIRDAKCVCVGLSFSESDFLQDLTTAVPVFIKDGLYYRWSHKSLAEYFAAQYICTEGKDKQEDVFSHLKKSKNLDRFQNMLDQVYDLDQPAFRKYFSHPFATAFMKFRESSYKEVSALVPFEEIELRRACTFTTRIVFAKGDFPQPNVLMGSDSENDSNHIINMSEFWSTNLSSITAVDLPNSKMPLIIIRLRNEFSTVAEILETKRDPLTDSSSRLLSGVKPLPIKNLGRKITLHINDEPTQVLNTPENFAPVTRALLLTRSQVAVINIDECENLCNNFADEQTKDQFTKNLLANIIA